MDGVFFSQFAYLLILAKIGINWCWNLFTTMFIKRFLFAKTRMSNLCNNGGYNFSFAAMVSELTKIDSLPGS